MPNNADKWELLVMAVTKAVIAVIIVGTVCYAILTNVNIDGELLKIVLLVIGAYFGFSSKVYHDSYRNSKH